MFIKWFLDIAHPKGPGQIKTITCQVKWNFYIPKIRTDNSFILITCHGIHSHPPPPPKRTPVEIINGLIQVLQKINDPSLTKGK